MRPSPQTKVLELYEQSAESYAELMDSEIGLPIYADIIGRLAERIADLSGPVIDTSCGPGHMLSKYLERDDQRSLLGIDLSPRMVAIATSKLGSNADIVTGDMRDLRPVESGSSAAVVSFFAIHHLSPDEVVAALGEWHRVLRPGGQLVLAAWEGTGAIDYGDESDVVALRFSEKEVASWVRSAELVVDRCVVEPVEEMPMAAIYLEGTKDQRPAPEPAPGSKIERVVKALQTEREAPPEPKL